MFDNATWRLKSQERGSLTFLQVLNWCYLFGAFYLLQRSKNSECVPVMENRLYVSFILLVLDLKFCNLLTLRTQTGDAYEELLAESENLRADISQVSLSEVV